MLNLQVTQTWEQSDGWFTLPCLSRAPAQQGCTDAKDVIFIDQLQALHAGVKPQGSSLPFDGWVVRWKIDEH